MTEDEAKTKWCPFVRFHVEGKAPAFTATPNRDQRGTRCLGSACMAWRWGTYEGPPPGAEPGKFYVGHRYVSEADGYCGLAGAPQ